MLPTRSVRLAFGTDWTGSRGSVRLPNQMSSRRYLLALVVVLAAACGTAAGDVHVTRVQRVDFDVRPTPPPLVHPLTGEGFPAPQAWQSRQALAIKVENSPASRPQSGLGEADVVFEELTEGGVTRFIAIFHSTDAETVGPVRSARRMDPQIVAPIGVLFAYSGAVPGVVALVRNTGGVTDVGYDRATSAYYRSPGRRAPHNLYTSTAALWKGREGSPPEPLFSFLDLGADPSVGGRDAASFSFAFAGNSDTVRYAYDADTGTYLRSHGGTPHTTSGGDQVAVTNVIVQSVGVSSGSTVDAAGQATPDTQVVGDGKAVLFRGGRAIEGRWTRSSVGAKTSFVDVDGEPMQLARGSTWIELVPRARSITIG